MVRSKAPKARGREHPWQKHELFLKVETLKFSLVGYTKIQEGTIAAEQKVCLPLTAFPPHPTPPPRNLPVMLSFVNALLGSGVSQSKTLTQ